MRVLAGVFFILATLSSMAVGFSISEQPEITLTGATLSAILYAAGGLARHAPLNAPPKGRLVRGTGYLLISLGVLTLASSVEDVLFGLEAPVNAFYGIGFALLFGLPGFLLVRLGWCNAELQDELEELKSRVHAQDS